MWCGVTSLRFVTCSSRGGGSYSSNVALVGGAGVLPKGVPHHVDGEWLESARVSQLNAAACALGRLRKISHPHLQCGICGGVEGGVGHW